MPRLVDSYRLAVASNGLLTSLISYWKLDETTGSRADSKGSNTLSVNGSLSYTSSGKISNAVSFSGAAGAFLSAASNSGLQTGNTNFWCSFWLYSGSLGNRLAVAKAGGGGGNEWSVSIDPSDNKIWFVLWNAQTVITKSPSAISANTWYKVDVWVDASANTANIAINNGTVQSNSLSSYPSAGSDPFVIGAYSGGSYNWIGYIDEVAFYKRVPTSTDRTNLYNGGSGLDYSLFT